MCTVLSLESSDACNFLMSWHDLVGLSVVSRLALPLYKPLAQPVLLENTLRCILSFSWWVGCREQDLWSVCNWLGYSAQALQPQPLSSAKTMVALSRDAVCWASAFFLLSRRSKSHFSSSLTLGFRASHFFTLDSCLLIKTNKQKSWQPCSNHLWFPGLL